MKLLFYTLLLLGFVWSPSARAITPAELAKRAEADYQTGHYESAIQNWQELQEIGFVNGDLYYNIASAYWRMGKVGQARLNFLKARDWSPRDPEIRQNLAFLESKVEKPGAAAVGPLALLKKLPFYRLSLNGTESLVWSSWCSLGLFACLVFYRWKRKTLYLAAAALFVLPLGFGISQYLLRQPFHLGPDPAVVLTPKLALRENPLPDAPVREEVVEGGMVRVRKSQGDFALVKSPSGKEGWVEKSSLGVIE